MFFVGKYKSDSFLLTTLYRNYCRFYFIYPGYAWGIASHLNGVKNGDELRAAYEENQPKIVKANMKFSQSKPLYNALLKVQRGWEDAEVGSGDDFVTSQKKRAVENSLRGMTLGGVGLEEGSPEQIRFKEIKMRFAELSTAFSTSGIPGNCPC